MITDPQGTVLALFLVFCRIGGCVLALPGFSSARVPEQLRVFIAGALSIALMPLLWDTVYPAVHTGAGTYIGLIFSESLVGLMYGMLARIYTLGMQFAATIIAMMVGYTQPGSADVIEDAPENQPFRLHHLCRHHDSVHHGISITSSSARWSIPTRPCPSAG